ncbi:hypothetical protein [Streptomyces aureocirculatus]|uniref:hypothetical protein n=1 Tax=Streptomyces aureocirculatus TaxID=67275 RepID=UPI0004C8D0A2|nr:hypothetical protein [Streptomyces aureocirculatus]
MRADNTTALVADLTPEEPPRHAVPVTFHRVIMPAPTSETISGWHIVPPPDEAFDPAAVRLTPVGQVQAGDTVMGTVQAQHDGLLQPLDQALWMSYSSRTCKPQTGEARPFDPGHCDHCAHEAYVRGVGAGSGHWTVDGCTTYQPDSLVLVVPRKLRCPLPTLCQAACTVAV